MMKVNPSDHARMVICDYHVIAEVAPKSGHVAYGCYGCFGGVGWVVA